MLNLSAAVLYQARLAPQQPAILYGAERITYAMLADRIVRASGGLAARGVAKGTVVALLMKNSPAFIELTMAVSHLGAVTLPINFRLAVEEVRHILSDSGAALLIADDEFAAVAGALDLPVMIADGACQHDARALFPAEVRPAPRAHCGESDLFRLMYTSGTTDRPKGVMHTYANFHWKCYTHIVSLGLGRRDRLLVVGPLYHVGGFDLPGVAVLLAGGTIDLHRNFDPVAALSRIESEKLTGAWLAPVMLNAIMGSGRARDFDLSSLEWCIGGGERTPETRIRDFASVFPTARYIDAYGLTETSAGDTLMLPGHEISHIGSVGPALPFVEVSIIGNDNIALGAGETGEICVRGPKVTNAYWNAPEKNAASFHDGWLHTGDVGHLDAEGFLYLTDRKKDLIISGGENIASSEVERVIYELPQVSEAAVIGRPDPQWGERPCAFVVLKAGQALDYPTLAAHCAARLARFKVPDALFVRDALPRNPSGKVLKHVLRRELAG